MAEYERCGTACGDGLTVYADDTVLLAESEEMLQRIVGEFDRVCKRNSICQLFTALS